MIATFTKNHQLNLKQLEYQVSNDGVEFLNWGFPLICFCFVLLVVVVENAIGQYTHLEEGLCMRWCHFWPRTSLMAEFSFHYILFYSTSIY